MGVIKALDGNAAIAHGVMRSKVQLVAAYPGFLRHLLCPHIRSRRRRRSSRPLRL